MVGLIVFFGVLTAVAMGSVYFGRNVATKVCEIEGIGKRISAPRLAAVVAPLVAFVVFSGAVAMIAPPQSEFSHDNVSWDSRETSTLGSLGDAVMLRTSGATVNPGYLYSTATFRGQTWFSTPGSQWVPGGVGVALLAYAITALVIGGFTAAIGVVMTHGQKWMATAKVAFTGAQAAVKAAA
jgi:hypothetical protein